MFGAAVNSNSRATQGSCTLFDPGRQRTLFFIMNNEPETLVIAGSSAATSFAGTENGRDLRTENGPKTGCPGR